MDPERALAARLKHGYGMTPADLRAMLDAQDAVCAICKSPLRKPIIDHDHRTGAVRGLVCNRCNCWLAPIEAQGFIERALAYLSAAASRPVTFWANQRWVDQRKQHQQDEHLRRFA